MRNKKWLLAVLLCGMMMGGGGCKKQPESLREDMAFTVCDQTRIPDELAELMEKKRGSAFSLSYMNSQNLYIAVGYGEHDRKNLCVVVEELFRTERAIYIKTRLCTDEATPTDGQPMGEESMYPYIVLKCDRVDLPIIYE